MMRPGVAISALFLTLSLTQPGHGAAIHAGAAVKAETRAVAGNHIVKAKSRHRLRSGRGFGHRRSGRHRGGFRHGRRHGNTKFLLGLAFPFAYFAYGPDVRYNYYGGHTHGHGHAGYSAGCRAVIKYGFDRFGRRAKIGGTMCFDRYGNSYILSHSRHVIHYY